MKINIIEIAGKKLAEVKASHIVLGELQDAIDILGNSNYLGASGILIQKDHIAPEFFDLRTGLAGDILQKFSTYQMRLAIIGDFTEFTSKSLQDFIRESNRLKRINFVSSVEEARSILSSDATNMPTY